MRSPAQPSRGITLGASPHPLAEVYDTGVFDLDGVVYMGGEPIADSPRHITRAAAAGMTVAYVTNNAYRPPEGVAERLQRIGVPCNPADVVTSAQAAARLVAAQVPEGSRVLVVGGDGLVHALAEHGLQAVSAWADKPAAVVQGFDPEVGWRLLAEGAAAVTAGVPWIASNTDATVATAHGPAPGNGQLVEVVARTTGERPEVAGKPETPLFEETLRRVGGRHPLVVGDRLDTDIEGAVRWDADSMLLLTGVTDVAALAQAPPGRRPTYVAEDLGGLFDPHPRVSLTDGAAHCAGWTAATTSGSDGASRPELEGEGRSVDALRALVSLSWEQRDRYDELWSTSVLDTAWRAALATP